MPLQVSVPSKPHLPVPTITELAGAKELLVWDDDPRDEVRCLIRAAERKGVAVVGKSPAARKMFSVLFTGA